METCPITIEDYSRIFNTVHAIVTVAGENINHSCLYFSILGCLVLQENYRIAAQVGVGLAAYRLAQDVPILLRGQETEQGLISSEDGFHAWVETEDWYIDFSAPLIPDICREKMISGIYKPKMFLKQKCQMAGSLTDMQREGDFLFERNDELRDDMIEDFCADKGRDNMARLCCEWYERPPKQMRAGVVHESIGCVTYVSLELDGAW